MTSNLTKEDILQILNAEDSDVIRYMAETVKYRENHLITYSKNVFIPLTEICRNDCGYCNFKKNPDDSEAIILKTKEEVSEILKVGDKNIKRSETNTGDLDDHGLFRMKEEMESMGLVVAYKVFELGKFDVVIAIWEDKNELPPLYVEVTVSERED